MFNHSEATLRGELGFDAALFQTSERVAAGSQGRIAFELSPQGQRTLVLRALPSAGGNTTTLSLLELVASTPKGERIKVAVQGEGMVDISAP